MRKILITLVCMIMLVFSITACGIGVEPVDTKVVALKGPTAMGMVNFMEGIEHYDFAAITAIDEVTAMLGKGEVDIAAIPANLAAVLYQNTEGAIQVVALNTLGVLYIVENGNSISNVEDLKGKTIIASGKGSTPEMCLRYVLLENNIDPDKDVTIEWKTEQSECLAYVTANEGAIAMMPEPFITTGLLASPNLNVQIDLTKEWDAIQEGMDESSMMITGVVVARTEFIEAHPETMADFMKEYSESVAYVNENIEEAATTIGDYGIVSYETAVVAIPNCNITYIDGIDMKNGLEGYLEVLYNQNPQSIGGSMPHEGFYYIP